MMSSDFYFRDKISVAVLGAASEVGQALVQCLIHHPWFDIGALCDANEYVGQSYGKAIAKLSTSVPESIQNMPLQPCEPPLPVSLVFSALRLQEAMAIEERFAEGGYYVVSCTSDDRKSNIPLIVAEVNRDQVAFIQKQQKGRGGGIVAIPNSIAIGLSLALKPLLEEFGLKTVEVVASQASDGTKMTPEGEEHLLLNSAEENAKIEQQSLILLGQLKGKSVQKASFKISVQSQRVLDAKNDIAEVSVKLKRKVRLEEILQAWKQFGSESQRLQLPSAPYHPLDYMNAFDDLPHQLSDKGMSIYLTQLTPFSPSDYKFHLILSHHMRGMVGSMLLIAELLVTQGKIYW